MKDNDNNPPVSASINSYSSKGKGIGIFEKNQKENSIEIPYTIAGEKILASVERKKKGIYKGKMEEILLPSPHRIHSKCVHFGICGGCSWQHIAYEEQIRIKETKITSLFTPFLNNLSILYPIIQSNPSWQYRNKMEFSFSADKEGKKFLGLVMEGSKGKVLNLQECHLVNPWMVQALKVVKSWWEDSGLEAYHPYKNTGSLRTITLREGMRTADRMVILHVSGNPDYSLKKIHLNNFIASLRKEVEPEQASLSIILKIQQIAKGKRTQFYEMILYGPDTIREKIQIELSENASFSFDFKISPSAFFQPNTSLAEMICRRAFQMTEISKNDIVYDLYCGSGMLGICAAKFARQVVGIEMIPESVLDARENAKWNAIENISIYEGDVGKILASEKLKNTPKPDIVIVDPPRAGLDSRAIENILQLAARRLIYISCNPSTQAENMQKLFAKYEIASMQPIDQFPQTSHVENIVVMNVKSESYI